MPANNLQTTSIFSLTSQLSFQKKQIRKTETAFDKVKRYTEVLMKSNDEAEIDNAFLSLNQIDAHLLVFEHFEVESILREEYDGLEEYQYQVNKLIRRIDVLRKDEKKCSQKEQGQEKDEQEEEEYDPENPEVVWADDVDYYEAHDASSNSTLFCAQKQRPMNNVEVEDRVENKDELGAEEKLEMEQIEDINHNLLHGTSIDEENVSEFLMEACYEQEFGPEYLETMSSWEILNYKEYVVTELEEEFYTQEYDKEHPFICSSDKKNNYKEYVMEENIYKQEFGEENPAVNDEVLHYKEYVDEVNEEYGSGSRSLNKIPCYKKFLEANEEEEKEETEEEYDPEYPDIRSSNEMASCKYPKFSPLLFKFPSYGLTPTLFLPPFPPPKRELSASLSPLDARLSPATFGRKLGSFWSDVWQIGAKTQAKADQDPTKVRPTSDKATFRIRPASSTPSLPSPPPPPTPENR